MHTCFPLIVKSPTIKDFDHFRCQYGETGIRYIIWKPLRMALALRIKYDEDNWRRSYARAVLVILGRNCIRWIYRIVPSVCPVSGQPVWKNVYQSILNRSRKLISSNVFTFGGGGIRFSLLYTHGIFGEINLWFGGYDDVSFKVNEGVIC